LRNPISFEMKPIPSVDTVFSQACLDKIAGKNMSEINATGFPVANASVNIKYFLARLQAGFLNFLLYCPLILLTVLG